MPLGERFLFDESFDEKDLARAEAEAEAKRLAEETALMEPELEIPTFSENDVKEAEEKSFKAGHESGLKEAAGQIEAHVNEALGVISDRMADLFNRQALDAAATFAVSANIAVSIAKKSFPYLNKTSGFQEIEQMVKDVLSEVLEETRVIIYVNTTLKNLLEKKIMTIANNSNFEGHVVILEDDKIEPGDCRITWSNGSAERNLEGTISKIEQIVAANLNGIEHQDNDSLTEVIEDNASIRSKHTGFEPDTDQKSEKNTHETEVNPETSLPPHDSPLTDQEPTEPLLLETENLPNEGRNTETLSSTSEPEPASMAEVEFRAEPLNTVSDENGSILDETSNQEGIETDEGQNATSKDPIT